MTGTSYNGVTTKASNIKESSALEKKWEEENKSHQKPPDVGEIIINKYFRFVHFSTQPFVTLTWTCRTWNREIFFSLTFVIVCYKNFNDVILIKNNSGLVSPL